MATLAIFILGIVLITLLSRYNNSNKLFWTLLTCYMLGFVGCKLVYDSFSKKESNTKVMQVQPTQALAVTSSSLVYLLVDENLPTSVKVTSNPVSQANVPHYESATLSDVPGVTKGIYLHVLPNPPNNVEIVDES
jgi:hypothetical protein